METLKPILAKHPFFEHLDDPYLELLAGCAINRVFLAGEYLFRRGEEATHFYIIRRGRVAVDMDTPDGPVSLYTHESGDVIGWSWLFSPYHWYYTGRALQPTRAIMLDGVCLRRKCEQDRRLGYEFMKRFAHEMMSSLDATLLQVLDMYGAAWGQPVRLATAEVWG